MTPFERPVSEVMHSPAATVPIDALLVDAEARLRELDVSSLGVTGRDGTLAGVVSYRDLLRIGHVMGRYMGAVHTTLELPTIAVGDVMSERLVTVGPAETVSEAARRLVESRVHRLYVVDGDVLVGVLSTREVMLAVVEARVRIPLSRFMSSPVTTVGADETLARAVEKLSSAGVSGLVVLEDGAPGGLFTEVEAVASRGMPPSTFVGDVVEYQAVCLPPNTPLYRGAAFAANARARRVLVLEGDGIVGIVTSLDFARAAF